MLLELNAREKSGNFCFGTLPFFRVLLATSPFHASTEEAVRAFVMEDTALPACTRMRRGGVGVEATAAAIPALADGLFWPSPSPGTCTNGARLGRGGREGMPLFDAISISSAMVFSVVVRVMGRFSCRVYLKSGTNL